METVFPMSKRLLDQIPRLKALSRRKIHDKTMAEDAFQYVMEKLMESERAGELAFVSQEHYNSLVTVSAVRHLVDFRRKENGRPQVPEWVRAKGIFWIRLYRLLCIERMSMSETIHAMTSESNNVVRVFAVKNLARYIRWRKPDCGKPHWRKTVAYEDGEPENKESATLEDLLIQKQNQALYEIVIAYCLENEVERIKNANLDGAFERFRSMISLDREERFFLKMIYQDQKTVKEAAAVAFARPYRNPADKKKGLIERIRNAMEKSGLGKELRLLRQ